MTGQPVTCPASLAVIARPDAVISAGGGGWGGAVRGQDRQVVDDEDAAGAGAITQPAAAEAKG